MVFITGGTLFVSMFPEKMIAKSVPSIDESSILGYNSHEDYIWNVKTLLNFTKKLLRTVKVLCANAFNCV